MSSLLEKLFAAGWIHATAIRDKPDGREQTEIAWTEPGITKLAQVYHSQRQDSLELTGEEMNYLIVLANIASARGNLPPVAGHAKLETDRELA